MVICNKLYLNPYIRIKTSMNGLSYNTVYSIKRTPDDIQASGLYLA